MLEAEASAHRQVAIRLISWRRFLAILASSLRLPFVRVERHIRLPGVDSHESCGNFSVLSGRQR